MLKCVVCRAGPLSPPELKRRKTVKTPTSCRRQPQPPLAVAEGETRHKYKSNEYKRGDKDKPTPKQRPTGGSRSRKRTQPEQNGNLDLDPESLEETFWLWDFIQRELQQMEVFQGGKEDILDGNIRMYFFLRRLCGVSEGVVEDILRRCGDQELEFELDLGSVILLCPSCNGRLTKAYQVYKLILSLQQLLDSISIGNWAKGELNAETDKELIVNNQEFNIFREIGNLVRSSVAVTVRNKNPDLDDYDVEMDIKIEPPDHPCEDDQCHLTPNAQDSTTNSWLGDALGECGRLQMNVDVDLDANFDQGPGEGEGELVGDDEYEDSEVDITWEIKPDVAEEEDYVNCVHGEAESESEEDLKGGFKSRSNKRKRQRQRQPHSEADLETKKANIPKIARTRLSKGKSQNQKSRATVTDLVEGRDLELKPDVPPGMKSRRSRIQSQTKTASISSYRDEELADVDAADAGEGVSVDKIDLDLVLEENSDSDNQDDEESDPEWAPPSQRQPSHHKIRSENTGTSTRGPDPDSNSNLELPEGKSKSKPTRKPAKVKTSPGKIKVGFTRGKYKKAPKKERTSKTSDDPVGKTPKIKISRYTGLPIRKRVKKKPPIFHCKAVDCSEKFGTMKELISHRFVHVSGYNCKIPGCPDVISSVRALFWHLRSTKHQDLESYKRINSCRGCSTLIPEGKVSGPSFARHLAGKGEFGGCLKQECHDLALTCPEVSCGERFQSEEILKLHVELFHDNPPDAPFACLTCGQRFRFNNALKTHQATHVQERNFICEKCGAAFKSAHYLRKHFSSLHMEGGRKHRCSTCGKEFRRLDHCRRHEAGHLGARHFLCNICGKSYKTKDTLKIHISTLHPDPDPDRSSCEESEDKRGGKPRGKRIKRVKRAGDTETSNEKGSTINTISHSTSTSTLGLLEDVLPLLPQFPHPQPHLHGEGEGEGVAKEMGGGGRVGVFQSKSEHSELEEISEYSEFVAGVGVGSWRDGEGRTRRM